MNERAFILDPVAARQHLQESRVSAEVELFQDSEATVRVAFLVLLYPHGHVDQHMGCFFFL